MRDHADAALRQNSGPRGLVAILDWRNAAALRDNKGLVGQARAAGASRRNQRSGAHKTLIVRADGSCQLERSSVAAVARRLGGGRRPVRRRTGKRG